jgi:hypothetical protein
MKPCGFPEAAAMLTIVSIFGSLKHISFLALYVYKVVTCIFKRFANCSHVRPESLTALMIARLSLSAVSVIFPLSL